MAQAALKGCAIAMQYQKLTKSTAILFAYDAAGGAFQRPARR